MIPERVWAEVDLDALAHNLAVVRRRAGAGVGIVQIVKADAYGHGAVAIAHHAVRCGVAGLGVGTSGEALELRDAGVRAPIVVLGTLVEDEVSAALHHQVEFGLHSSDRLRRLEEVAAARGLIARVHLNVDTGMGRLGVLPDRALELLEDIRAARHLELAGIMTHVTASEGAFADSTVAQMAAFGAVVERARALGLRWRWTHVANSACVFSDLEPMYDTVRPGIATYGALPAPLPGREELRGVMSLSSQVVFLKDVPAGTPVGYGATWVAERASRLATLPLGFADGVPTSLSNRGTVLLRGRRAPIIGRVNMDYTVLDVTDHPGVVVGDRATILGVDGDERITLEELAAEAGCMTYEVTCSVGRRVPRLYRGGEQLSVPAQALPEAPRAPTPAPQESPL